MTFYDELVWRGLIKDVSSEDLKDKLNAGGMTFYIGTDPTGDSLHIGHFSSFLMSKRLKDAGHHPILLVGGATGQIGDPKPTTERPMITKEQVQHNFDCLKKQAEDLFGFEVVNNLDWSKDLNFIDWLRDYGKYFNINYMLSKDIIKRRLDEGITFTEFSYMIMQAMDFYYLHENKGCNLQVAGQDQWGNITAGIELIRKKTGDEAYGFTMPLLTKSDGTKFGKSEGNAIWLDRKKTSPYELYQFLFNTDDSKVIEYLKKLTFLTKEEIDALEVSLKEDAGRREAQKKLAEEVVRDLHGEEGLESALKITNALFRGQLNDLDEQQRLDAVKNMDKVDQEAGKTLIDVLVEAKIASSRREAREWIKGNSISLNGVKVNDETLVIDSTQAYVSNYVIIRRGKKRYYCLNLK